MLKMNCNPSLYHYNGFCFNKSRIPKGQLAIREEECFAMSKKEEEEVRVTTIIS